MANPTAASPPILTVSDGRAVVRLNRPQHRNRIEPADVAVLHDILTRIEQDESIRVFVLTAVGTTFCAGYDLVTIANGSATREGRDFGNVHEFGDAVGQLESCRVPTICGLNGPAYGGGADLALACDVRIGIKATHVAIPASRFGLLVTAIYGVSFWLPQIIRNLSGLGDFAVGLTSAIPYLLAAICMVPVARHSDATGERRWHVAVPCATGAAAMFGAAFIETPILGLMLLSCAAIGIWAALGPCWALPMSVLTGPAAAAGLALINSIGNLGGFVGPSLIGFAREATNSYSGGLLVIAASLLGAAAVALAVPHDRQLELVPGTRIE